MKKRKNYIGKYIEPVYETITSVFCLASLKSHLENIVNETSEYTEKEFVDWCYKNFTKKMDSEEENSEMNKALNIAEDIDIQWDLFLANSFSLSDLQKIDFNKIQLPKEWYIKWVEKCN